MAENIIRNIENKTYSIQNLSDEFKFESLNILSDNVKDIVKQERDFIFPVDWKDLGEHIYFNSAYTKTKTIADKLIKEWPLGKNGNIVSSWPVSLSTDVLSVTASDSFKKSLIQQQITYVDGVTANRRYYWKEDLEQVMAYYNNLTFYEKWVLDQLAGATTYFYPDNSLSSVQTYKRPTFTIKGAYISATSSLTSNYIDIDNADSDYVIELPVILRDNSNNLMMPFGWPYSQNPGYQDEILQTYSVNSPRGDAPFYEVVITTALAFDEGINFALTHSSGTGSHKYTWESYDGVKQSEYFPASEKVAINRPARLNKLVPPQAFADDNDGVLERFLSLMAEVLDDTKLYVDNFTNLFKNYWANWDKIPRGLLQKIVAFQLGVELFSSSNNGISDLVLRNKRSISDITYEFWNRVLCTLIYAYKTKGTIESIKSIVRAYGFPESIIEVDELCKKYYSYDHYKYDIQSTAALKLGNDDTSVQSISANVTNSLTGDFHLSFRFRNINYSNTGSWKNVFVNDETNPSFSIKMKEDYDSGNANNRYIAFLVDIDGISLTTNYAFYSNATNTNQFITFALTRSNNLLDVMLGSNYDSPYYSDPTTASVTSTVSASTITLSSMVIGNNTESPNIYLQEFIVDNNILDHDKFITRVNNFENFSNIDYSTVDSIVVNYKLKENVDFSISGQNYIIDSSKNNFHGTPIYGTLSKVPYGYFPELFKSIKYNTVGFNIPISARLSDLTIKDIKMNNLKVGISTARAINEDIENYLGDVEISDLMFDPVEYFNESNDFINLEYTNLENKKKEIFSRYQETFKPWKITSFIERVEGHLSSFFKFVEQFVPIKEKIIEKGIIYEDYSLSRTRLRKPWMATPIDLMLSVNKELIADTIAIFVENPITLINIKPENSIVLVPVMDLALDNIFDIVANKQALYNDILVISDNITISDKLHNIAKSTIDPKLSVGYRDVSIKAVPINTGNKVGLKKDSAHIVESQILQSSYKNNIYNITYLKPGYYNRNRENDITMQLSFNVRDIFISTAYYEPDYMKRLEGLVILNSNTYSSVSKFQSPNVPVVSLNTTDMKDQSGVNLLKVTIDDYELSNDEENYSLVYKYKRGIKFVITTKGSFSEGLDLNQEVKIKFTNLINPNDDILVLNFYIGYSLSDFAQQKGYTLISNI